MVAPPSYNRKGKTMPLTKLDTPAVLVVIDLQKGVEVSPRRFCGDHRYGRWPAVGWRAWVSQCRRLVSFHSLALLCGNLGHRNPWRYDRPRFASSSRHFPCADDHWNGPAFDR